MVFAQRSSSAGADGRHEKIRCRLGVSPIPASTNGPAIDTDEIAGCGRLCRSMLNEAWYGSRSVSKSAAVRLMKPTAMLINVARAEIVDEDALYLALAEGRLAGAALDVWYRYPTSPEPVLPARRPFHELPNVLMTPHVSAWTDGMLKARAQVIAENVRRITRHEPPVNLIASTPLDVKA